MENNDLLNSRHRVLKAMKLEHPDVVPLMCQFSIGFMLNQLKPNPAHFWYDEDLFANGLVQLREEFQFDGILISLHGHSNQWKENLIQEEQIDHNTIKLHYQDRVETHQIGQLPVIDFKEDKTPPSIESIDIDIDIPTTIDYIPVSHNLHFRIDQDKIYSIFYKVNELTQGRYSLHGEITSPFDYFLDLFGYENGLIALITEPEKSKAIIQKYAQGVKAIAKGMCQAPIDAIKISSPFAGKGFISREFYKDFVLPYETDIIETIRSNGKEVYIHTCGHINDRIELMAKSGASGLECLDPKPLGDTDLDDAFQRIGKSMFIKGNIDSVNTLLFGCKEQIREDISKIIETGKNKGKGFILSTACSIAPDVSKDNVKLLSQLVREFGKY